MIYYWNAPASKQGKKGRKGGAKKKAEKQVQANTGKPLATSSGSASKAKSPSTRRRG